MDVYPVTWSAGDTGPGGSCRITAFGKAPDGASVCVHVRFTPYFFVKMPKEYSDARAQLFVTECSKRYEGLVTNKCAVVKRKCLWGYQAGAVHRFAQLAFDSVAAHKRARYDLPRRGFDTYEARVDPLVRLFHLRDVSPCRWVRVAAWTRPHRIVADVDVEIECALTAVGPSDRTTRPPLVFASFDIEAYSHKPEGNQPRKFPDGDDPRDHLIQVSTTFQRYGEPEPYHRLVTCLRETADVEGVQIVWSDKEEEVIERWAREIRAHKADVLLAYNSHQFDWRFISQRMGVLVDDDTADPLVNADLFGRTIEGGGTPREFNLSSGAYGKNTFFVLDTPGMQQLDLYQYVRREFKLASYSLNNVAKTYLGDSKLDLPPEAIFEKFDGTPGDRADIARYAVRDTELPLRLLAKLNAWENLVEMANAVRVPMEDLLSRGQQVKVYSALLGKARAMGFVIPDDKAIKLAEGAKFEGATVLDARTGAYFDVVSALDYASLVSFWGAGLGAWWAGGGDTRGHPGRGCSPLAGACERVTRGVHPVTTTSWRRPACPCTSPARWWTPASPPRPPWSPPWSPWCRRWRWPPWPPGSPPWWP